MAPRRSLIIALSLLAAAPITLAKEVRISLNEVDHLAVDISD